MRLWVARRGQALLGLDRLLDRIKEADPSLVDTRKYQALLQFV